MKAIVRIPFRGVPDGEHHVRLFQVGEVLEGELALAAIGGGMAVAEGKAQVAPGPTETQALGGAPEPFREPTKAPVRRRRERPESDR
jgi:hypothetical protein